MKALQLILKDNPKVPWFTMVKSGIKKQEYRDITPYYMKMFMRCYGKKGCCGNCSETIWDGNRPKWPCYHEVYNKLWPKWGLVTFYHGYAVNRPSVTLKIESITIGEGKPEWGAVPGKKYFIINLGDIVEPEKEK